MCKRGEREWGGERVCWNGSNIENRIGVSCSNLGWDCVCSFLINMLRKTMNILLPVFDSDARYFSKMFFFTKDKENDCQIKTFSLPQTSQSNLTYPGSLFNKLFFPNSQPWDIEVLSTLIDTYVIHLSLKSLPITPKIKPLPTDMWTTCVDMLSNTSFSWYAVLLNKRQIDQL